MGTDLGWRVRATPVRTVSDTTTRDDGNDGSDFFKVFDPVIKVGQKLQTLSATNVNKNTRILRDGENESDETSSWTLLETSHPYLTLSVEFSAVGVGTQLVSLYIKKSAI